MQLRVDGSALTYLSGRLRTMAATARELAQGLRRIDITGLDATIDPALREMTNFGGDVFDLVAVDLDVIAAALRSGGALYRHLEATLAAAETTTPR